MGCVDRDGTSIFDAVFLSLSLLTGVEKVHLLVMQLKTPAPAVSADDDTDGPPVLCLHPSMGGRGSQSAYR